MRLLGALSVVLLAGAITLMAAALQSSTGYSTRVVPHRPPSIGLPLTTYHLQQGLASLGWGMQVPIGFEALQDEPPDPPTPDNGQLQIAGGTLAEALDQIVAREPRYGWSEENGVIHVRPKTAHADATDILNRPVAAFELHDATLGLALREVRFYLRPELRGGGIVGGGPVPGPLGLRLFSVRAEKTTLLGLLDAIVKAHGAATWDVTHVQDERWPDRIGFSTFDGWSTRM